MIGIKKKPWISLRTFAIQHTHVRPFLFRAESDIANYADGTTLYVCQKNLFDMQRKLQSKSTKLFQWFHSNLVSVVS